MVENTTNFHESWKKRQVLKNLYTCKHKNIKPKEPFVPSDDSGLYRAVLYF